MYHEHVYCQKPAFSHLKCVTEGGWFFQKKLSTAHLLARYRHLRPTPEVKAQQVRISVSTVRRIIVGPVG